MTITDPRPDPARTRPGPGPVRPRPRGLPPRAAVGALVVLAVLVRLPFLTTPLSSDEGGFLMVGGQWSPGPSLYGHYWVDRPPGLVALFAVVDGLGGQVPLRLLGALAAAVAVLAGGLLGRRLAPHRQHAPSLTALLVLALVSSPLLDVAEVDGEILALPFLLLGVWLLLRAVQGRHQAGLASAAGASAVAAASIKQNMIDVVVVAAVLVAVLALRGRRRDAAVLLGAFVAGATVVAGALLALAWSRGTTPAGLWEAVVVFRAQAAAVIAAHASAATSARGARLAWAFAATGAPAVLLLATRVRWRRVRSFSAEDPALSWVVAALLGWETLGVVAGGSYWLHYLVGLVPGLTVVLGLALARPDAPRRRGLAARPLASPHRTALGLVVLSTVVGLAGLAVHPPSRPADARAVIGYLRDHAAPGDTGVTAFGDPVLLQQSGLPSAYPDLWSLPVRVHDPRLADLTRLLDGPRRPTWVVVSGGSLASWGLDAGTADPALAEHYERVLTSGGLSVLRRVG